MILDWVIPLVAPTALTLVMFAVARLIDERNDRKYEAEQQDLRVAWDLWQGMTDDDREWFAAHDYAGPPNPDKQWSSGWL